MWGSGAGLGCRIPMRCDGGSADTGRRRVPSRRALAPADHATGPSQTHRPTGATGPLLAANGAGCVGHLMPQRDAYDDDTDPRYRIELGRQVSRSADFFVAGSTRSRSATAANGSALCKSRAVPKRSDAHASIIFTESGSATGRCNRHRILSGMASEVR